MSVNYFAVLPTTYEPKCALPVFFRSYQKKHTIWAVIIRFYDPCIPSR